MDSMPIYDFRCRKCGDEFEALVLKNTPACPECGSGELEQLISLFSVDSANTREANVRAVKARNNKIRKGLAIEQEQHARDHDH